jgi:hypothetical protein
VSHQSNAALADVGGDVGIGRDRCKRRPGIGKRGCGLELLVLVVVLGVERAHPRVLGRRPHERVAHRIERLLLAVAGCREQLIVEQAGIVEPVADPTTGIRSELGIRLDAFAQRVAQPVQQRAVGEPVQRIALSAPTPGIGGAIELLERERLHLEQALIGRVVGDRLAQAVERAVRVAVREQVLGEPWVRRERAILRGPRQGRGVGRLGLERPRPDLFDQRLDLAFGS